MGTDRFSSFLLSMCLHLGIVALVLLWPLPEPRLKDPKPPLAVSGFVTLGKAGKLVPNAKKMEPAEAKTREQPKVEKLAENVQPEATPLENPQAEVPTPPKVTPLEKMEPPKVEPPKVEPPKETPKAEPPKVEPPKEDPTAVAVPKEDTKKPPQKNATAAVKPQKNATVPAKNATATAPATPKPPAKNAAAAKPPAPKKGKSIDDALKGLEKEVKKGATAQGTTKKTGKTSGTLSSALDELGTEIGGAGNDAAGTGPGGSGGDGVGNLGPYEQVIVSSVRPNWRLPTRADRRSLSAVVVMWIEADGSISEPRLARSSGDRLFDSTLMTAIAQTRVLDEPPPGGALEATVEFVPQ